MIPFDAIAVYDTVRWHPKVFSGGAKELDVGRRHLCREHPMLLLSSPRQGLVNWRRPMPASFISLSPGTQAPATSAKRSKTISAGATNAKPPLPGGSGGPV